MKAKHIARAEGTLGSSGHLWLAASCVADALLASTLAIGGIVITSLPASVVIGTLATAVAFAVVLDLVKVPAHLRITRLRWSLLQDVVLGIVGFIAKSRCVRWTAGGLAEKPFDQIIDLAG